MQAILSVFVFGKPGIGKTETARVIHSKLYGQEDIIKLNFENYSGENALSSLLVVQEDISVVNMENFLKK